MANKAAIESRRQLRERLCKLSDAGCRRSINLLKRLIGSQASTWLRARRPASYDLSRPITSLRRLRAVVSPPQSAPRIGRAPD